MTSPARMKEEGGETGKEMSTLMVELSQVGSIFRLSYAESAIPTALSLLRQICGKGDTVEALSYLLDREGRNFLLRTQQSHASCSQAELEPAPSAPLSEPDMAKLKAAIKERDSGLKTEQPQPQLDKRVFSPVLREVLAGEGDHVLHKALQIHPLVNSQGRRSGGEGEVLRGKGSKRRKRDRSKSLSFDMTGELSRLMGIACADGTAQVLLILVKSLMCLLDQGGKRWEKWEKQRDSGGLRLQIEPLQRLMSIGVSDWEDLRALLNQAKAKERIAALKGKPGLTVCHGKADVKGRGRLEVRAALTGDGIGGVVSSLEVSPQVGGQHYFEATLSGSSRKTRVGWSVCGRCLGFGKGRRGGAMSGVGEDKLSWGFNGGFGTQRERKRYHAAAVVEVDERGLQLKSSEGGAAGEAEDDGGSSGEGEEEDCGLGLGGLFRESSVPLDAPVDDGGEVVDAPGDEDGEVQLMWEAGTVVGCLLDMSGEGSMFFFINGVAVTEGPVFSGFLQELAEGDVNALLCPAFSCGPGDGVSFNLGDAPFQHALAQEPLPAAVLDSQVSRCLRLQGEGWAEASTDSFVMRTSSDAVVEALVKLAPLPTRDDVTIFHITAGTGEDDGQRVIIAKVVGTRLVVRLLGVTDGGHTSAEGVMAPGQWKHVSVCSQAGGGLKCYVDAQLVPMEAAAPDVKEEGEEERKSEDGGKQQAARAPGVVLGGRWRGEGQVEDCFTGDVAYLRIWSNHRSALDIERFQGRRPVLESDVSLASLWKLEEGVQGGEMLMNARPLIGGEGSEGHAKLRGTWHWVDCFLGEDKHELSLQPACWKGADLKPLSEARMAVSDACSGSTLQRSVPCDTALLGVLGHFYRDSTAYCAAAAAAPSQGEGGAALSQLQELRRGEKALEAVVQPHVLTFLLLHSCLWQVAQLMEAMQPQEGSVAGPGQGSRQRQSQGQGQSQPGEAKDEGEHDKTALLLSAALALLRLLQANIYHIKVVAIPPGTVGLGWGSGSRPLGGLQEERNKPFAQRLLALLMDYVGGVLDVDGSTGQLEQLQVAVRAEAAEAIGIGLEIFYPQPADRAELLRCLLEQLVSDEHQAPVRAAGSEGGGDDRAADKAGLSCMIPSDLLGPSRSVLLSRVVRAICCTPRLMLDIIPEPARPVLSAQTLPRFIDATVRGSTEGSCWHCSLNVRPKAGDVVMRGPDWQWGNQDGQDKGAGYGLVVRVETLDKLRIMWSDGSVNVYRWGVLDAQGQRLFDVKIFRQWEGQGQRKPSSLRYSYDAVCAASQQSQGHAEGSVGDIMGYIFEAAPKAWLEGKEDELVAGEAVRLYKDFAEVFGAGGRQLEEEHACEALPKVLELLLQGWKKLSGDQGTEAAEASSAVLCLLLHLQSVLVGNDMTGAAEGARAGTQAREALTTPSHGGSDGEVHAFVGASGSTRVWDWKECRHCAAPTRVALPAEAHENAQARARPLSVDPSYCHSNLCLKGKGSQSEGFVIEQGSERGWGVALATVGFRRGSGVYSWQVRLDSVNRRGHVFLGLANHSVSLGSYLGSDPHGWGYLISQDLYHMGSRVRSGYGHPMGAGKTVELTFDTDKGTLTLGDSDTGDSFGPAFTDLYQSSNASTLFPAIAMHQPGDRITLLPCCTPLGSIPSLFLKVGAAAPLPVGCPYSALTAHCRWLLLELQAIMEQATAAGTLEAVQGALGHPVPAAGGLLRGAVAALTQWHMLGTEESEKLMGPVKAAVEASENMRAALKRVTDSRREDFDEAQACQEDLHQLLTLLACLAGKLLGGMISGGIGSRGSGEVQNDVLALARGGWTRAGEQDQAALMEGAGRDQLTVGPEPGIETGATDWMRSPLLAGGRTGEASGHRGTKRKTIKAFLNDLIENTEGTPACKLGAWVSKHVGENPILARLGGPQITRTIRGAVAVMLWHSGFAQCSHEMALALTPDRVAQSPPFFLLETWRKAGALRSWAKSSRDKGTPYDITAARVLARIDFLLELEPASPENAVQWVISDFLAGGTGADSGEKRKDRAPLPLSPAAATATDAQDMPPPPVPLRQFSSVSSTSSKHGESAANHASRVRMLETKQAQMLALVARFLRGPADVLALRSAQQAVEARARMREQGLCLLRSMLAAASAENSSGIKCALLLYLPPALRGLLQRLVALGPDSVALRSERESMAAAELTGNMQLPAKLDGHYLDTLDGCAATSKQRVRGAFEALYALLAEELDAAAQGGDHSLLLCLLDALGIVVREEDHSQLARLRIFTHLQELLDRTIAAANPMPVTSAGEAALDTAEWLSEARQPREDNPSAPTSHVLTQGIMKLVYLLAMPVAAASQEPSFQPPGAPPSMVRALSGPATLSHSVFQMLYTELKRILDGMRQRQKRRSRETAKADNAEEETLHRLEVLRDEAASLSLTRELQVILQEITMLLLCVSAADSCQRQLSRPRWIALLLRLLQIGLPYAQHRAFRLLRRLLPSCPPDILTPGPGDDWSIVATVKEDLTSVTVQSPTPGPAPFPPLAPAMVRATSLSSSSREGEIPARSLLCFVLDIIGEGFAAAPLVERYFEPGKGSGGGKGEVSDELVAYQGFELLQRGAPMVCEGVALLRTLLQHNEWRAVTSTLLEDALHRGSACLKQMAREAREAKLKEEAMEHLEGSGLGAPKKAFPSAAATTEHVNTLLRMLAALSVLGGQLNVLYPGGKAEVLPAESSSHSEGKSSRGPHVVLEGKLCTVMSLTLGEVMVEGERSDGSKVTCSLSPDRLQPVPEVDVEAPLLPPGLVKTALTTTRLWCLDPLYGHMFDSDCSRKEQHEGPGQAQGGRDSSSEESEPLAAVLTRKPLAMHVLLWLVRSSALRASQGLLMHSPTAWSCVRLLTADAAAGPTLLSLASTTSSCSGLGDLPVLEENLTALLAQWQHRVIEGRAQLVEAALSSRSERHGIKTESPPPIGSRSCSSTGAAKESTVDLLEDEGLGEEAEGGMPGQEIQGQALGGEAPPPDAFARQMSEMGFPLHWCQRALQETGNDIEVALNWILTNGELLAMEDSLRESIAEESESAGEGRSDSDQQVISLIGQAEDAIRRALSATSSISGADSGVAEGGSASATGQAERWQQGGSDSGASWPRVFHYDPHSTAFLNLRARPSLSAERVGAIFASEEVMAVGQCGEWLHIRYAGLDGSDDGEMEMDQDDDDDDENDQDDEEDEDDDDDEDEEGKQEDFQCEDCGVQHKAERLVWALRTASSRELLRPGPCAYNPQVAWERVSLNTPGSRPEESAPALTSQAAAAATGEADVPPHSVRYRIISRSGATVRGGIELDTPEVTSLAQGTEVLALGDEVRSSSGTSRVRLVLPVEGWASKKPNIMECLGPALSGDGDDEARLEDRMEDEAGGDLYNRDGRYFGARQGWLLPGATALAAAERQTKGRRSNLTGKSSVEEAWKALSVLPAAEAEARVMDMCHSLTIIQSRQLLLTLVLQAHMQVQVQGSEVADVLLNLFKGQGKEVSPAASAEQMVNFLRLILFRGWQPGWDALYRATSSLPISGSSSFRCLPSALSRIVTCILSSGQLFSSALQEALLQNIARQLRLAAARSYGDFNWFEPSSPTCTDTHCIRHPHLRFVVWASRILREADPDLAYDVFSAWTAGLRSPSLSLKQHVCLELSLLLHSLIERGRVKQLRRCLELLPRKRLWAWASLRLLKEAEDAPMMSRAMQALAELVSASKLAEEVLAKDCSRVAAPVLEAKQEQEKEKPKEQKADAPDGSARPVLSFSTPGAFVRLNGRDVEPPWTAEYWLMALDKPKTRSADPGPAPITPSAKGSASLRGGAPATKEQWPLPGKGENPAAAAKQQQEQEQPLPVLMRTSRTTEGAEEPQRIGAGAWGMSGRGRGGGRSLGRSASRRLSHDLPAPPPLPAPRKDSLPAQYLASSANCHIKLRSGGNLFTGLKDDNSEEVQPEAVCFAIGFAGDKDRAFDYVCPVGQWVHIALVATATDHTVTLYVNGEAKGSMVLRMALPMGSIGAGTLLAAGAGEPPTGSFVGRMALARYWMHAKTAGELRRDMGRSVSGVEGLVGLWGMCEGEGSLLADATHSHPGYLSGGASWEMVEGAPISHLPEPGHWALQACMGLAPVGNAGAGAGAGAGEEMVEMTGLLEREAVKGVEGIWQRWSSQIMTLRWHVMKRGEDGVMEISGAVDWPEEQAAHSFDGSISVSEDGRITFQAELGELLQGCPERIAWVEGMKLKGEFDGTVELGTLQGTWSATVRAPLLQKLSPGQMRFDEASMADCLVCLQGSQVSLVDDRSISGCGFSNRMAGLGPASGPAWATIEVCSIQAANAVTTAQTDAAQATAPNFPQATDAANFGLLSGQWLWELKIVSCRSGLGVGVCDAVAAAAAKGPKLCAPGDDSHSWCYRSKGQGLHGGQSIRVEDGGYSSGDVIGVELDLDSGSLRFLKNGRDIGLSWSRLDEAPAVRAETAEVSEQQAEVSSEGRGLRPFVFLSGAGDGVQLLGLKEGFGSITYPADDPQHRVSWTGQWVGGVRHGPGALMMSGSRGYWKGTWSYGKQHGVQLLVEVEEEGGAEKDASPFLLDMDTIVRPATEEEAGDLLSEWREAHAASATTAAASEQEANAKACHAADEEKRGDGEADRQEGSEPLSQHEARLRNRRKKYRRQTTSHIPQEGRGTSASRLERRSTRDAEAGLNVSEENKGKLLVSPLDDFLSDFESYSNNSSPSSRPLDASASAEEDGKEGEGLATPSAASESKAEEQQGDSSRQLDEEAEYTIKVVYSRGATIRSGIEIDESEAVGTMAAGTVTEAYARVVSSCGIPRFQTPSGWISERLRGGVEEPVVVILRHKPKKELKYRVVCRGGAMIRETMELNGPEVGGLPNRTVVTVAERRALPDGTIRLRVTEPLQCVGWISEKDHIVRREVTPEEALQQSHAAEAMRRQGIRDKRKERCRVLAEKEASRVAYDASCVEIPLKGTFRVSGRTFFLLNVATAGPGLHFSTDRSTLTCESAATRAMVLGGRGFVAGVHYWEVRVEKCNWGSVFIGVSPKHSQAWGGYGFLNYRACQAYGSETLYGAYYTAGDKVGVLLDMDRGTLAFVKDGEDFNIGRPVVVNMGIAYHHLRRNSREARCGLGMAMYPCFGVKSRGDQLSLSGSKWYSQRGKSQSLRMQELIDSMLAVHLFRRNASLQLSEASSAYNKWRARRTRPYKCRAGVVVDVDVSSELLREAAGDVAAAFGGLTVGQKVGTPYGDCRVLGTQRGDVWFTIESDEAGAWYWGTEELADLLNSGQVTLSAEEGKQGDADEPEEEEAVDGASAADFESLATTGWDCQAKDEALVRLVNAVSCKKGVQVCHLCSADLAEGATAGLAGTHSMLAGFSTEALCARFVALLTLNGHAMLAATAADLARSNDASLMLTERDVEEASGDPTVKIGVVSPMAASLVAVRGVLFTESKVAAWSAAVDSTTTFTLPNPDEYERPDEIREVELNRMQAHNVAVEGESVPFADRLRVSIFGQLQDIMLGWEDHTLRRSFVHMQDAGQRRAFYVKFKGEGVDDHGGPYRAVFQAALGEEPQELLKLLVPCPNGKHRIGPNQDQLLFNSGIEELSERQGQGLKLGGICYHMGRLLGVSVRHGIQVPLALPLLMWKSLAGIPIARADLEAVDKMLAKGLSDIERGRLDEEEEMEIVQVALESLEEGQQLFASLIKQEATLQQVVNFVSQSNLTSGAACLDSLYQGLAAVLPVELLSLFSGEEVEALFCGRPDVDIDLLQEVTEYEGVSPTEAHIQYFWEALRDMGQEERAGFVNFCSGRSRLPSSTADVPMTFKLLPPHKKYENPDDYLPIAQTCFFSLALPRYSSKEVCRRKLDYAISNAISMDADFLVHH